MLNKNIFILTLFFISFNTSAAEIVTGKHSLDFHGYIRTGLGMSKDGTTQAKFKAPGARASYRLGNEPDTDLELQFNYNYKMSKDKTDNAYVQGVFMLDGYKTHGSSSDFSVSNLAQGYLSFNQFFNSDTKIWLGRRYYDRKSLHISNHYWLNPGQGSMGGLGIEDVSAGTGKFNFAMFRYEDVSGTDLIDSTSLDARWHGIEVGENAKLTLWAGFTARHKQATLNYETKTGYGIGAWLDQKSSNMKNTTVFIYQTGPEIKQGDFNPKPIRENLAGTWNLDKARSFEISNALTYEKLPEYSFQWIALYRQEDHGISGNSKFNWASTGIRPIFYFSKHVNLALEAGIDYIDDKVNNRKGSLTKLTTALQLSADRGFYSRPVLRVFITLADWSDALKGQVGNTPGNAPYATVTQGWSVGAQAEVWW